MLRFYCLLILTSNRSQLNDLVMGFTKNLPIRHVAINMTNNYIGKAATS